jgi:hypothetical protein
MPGPLEVDELGQQAAQVVTGEEGDVRYPPVVEHQIVGDLALEHLDHLDLESLRGLAAR